MKHPFPFTWLRFSRYELISAVSVEWELSGNSATFPGDCRPAFPRSETDLRQALIQRIERLSQLVWAKAKRIGHAVRPTGILKRIQDLLDIRWTSCDTQSTYDPFAPSQLALVQIPDRTVRGRGLTFLDGEFTQKPFGIRIRNQIRCHRNFNNRLFHRNATGLHPHASRTVLSPTMTEVAAQPDSLRLRQQPAPNGSRNLHRADTKT